MPQDAFYKLRLQIESAQAGNVGATADLLDTYRTYLMLLARLVLLVLVRQAMLVLLVPLARVVLGAQELQVLHPPPPTRGTNNLSLG